MGARPQATISESAPAGRRVDGGTMLAELNLTRPDFRGLLLEDTGSRRVSPAENRGPAPPVSISHVYVSRCVPMVTLYPTRRMPAGVPVRILRGS